VIEHPLADDTQDATAEDRLIRTGLTESSTDDIYARKCPFTEDEQRRVDTLVALRTAGDAAEDATEGARRHELHLNMTFAIEHHTQYLDFERDGDKVRAFQESLHFDPTTSSHWNTIAQYAREIVQQLKIDDEVYGLPLRIPTRRRGLYALAAAFKRDADAVRHWFRDSGFEPTIRALDEIGRSIVDEPGEPALSSPTDADTEDRANANTEDTAQTLRETVQQAVETGHAKALAKATDDGRSKFTDYLNRLDALRDSQEPQDPVDFHNEAAAAFHLTEATVTVANYEVVKDRRVLRVVTEYQLGEDISVLDSGVFPAAARVDSGANWNGIKESLKDASLDTESGETA
jgi:hypothetical protein